MSQKKNREQRKPKSEVKLAEERFQNCIEKRNTLNEEARTIRDERNSLHDQRNKVMKEVLKYRKKMEVNKKTKDKHIKSRDSAMSKVKQLNELKQKKRKMFYSMVFKLLKIKENFIVLKLIKVELELMTT